MNVFERDAAIREPDAIISAWASVRASISELLESYNAFHPIGKFFPARVTSDTDKSLVIECKRGHTPGDDFSLVMITVSATLASSKEITGRIERWINNLPGSRSTEWTKTLKFTVATREPLRLSFKREMLSPEEVAVELLGDLRPEVP